MKVGEVMLKKIILIIGLFLITGCTSISINTLNIESSINSVLSQDNKLYNTYEVGYKFYKPRNFNLLKSDNNNYVYINNGNENNYLIDEFTSQEQVENAISQIEEAKNQILSNRSGDTYNDIKMVHDYLVDNIQYDTTISQQNIKMVHDYLVDNIQYDTTISQQNIYNIYGALINGTAVCEGYARSFKYLMDELGIPCTLVIGEGTNSQGQTENHAWNYVQINGNWYAIDCTWDDPVSTTGYVSQNSKYRYFLKGSNEFSKDHTPSGQFTEGGKVFNYPEISREDY